MSTYYYDDNNLHRPTDLNRHFPNFFTGVFINNIFTFNLRHIPMMALFLECGDVCEYHVPTVSH
jgi:hypothetical protein